MTTPPRRKRGLLTGLVAVATALTLAFSAAPAQADPPFTIDPEATGTIRIHKFEQSSTVGQPGTGESDDTVPDGATPLAGIVFTAQRVNDVILTTNAGWQEAADLTPETAFPRLDATMYRSGATTSEGLASIQNLPVGVYYVTETTFPNNVTPAAPFLVTIPRTNPKKLDEWIYTVDVFPKNATTTAEKNVVDAGAVKVGDNVDWTILADIPKVQTVDKYVIEDLLDEKLQFVSDVVSLTGASGVTLEPSDYGVTTTAGEPFRVTFTAAGRTKLASAWRADPAARVQVIVTTKVLAAGEITNAATVFPNSRSFGKTTPVATTKWGTIVLEKANSKNVENKLAGAEFQVFLTKEAATAKTSADAITINGQSTFTSEGVDGRVVIEGLRYSGFVNGKEVEAGAEGYRTYWIAETKAPAGFEMLAEPIEVIVDDVSTTVVDQQVLNVPKNAGFQLPLTGASGATSIIMLSGLLLLIVGTAAVVVSRRKRSQV